jgi:hypothetical protein
VAQALQGGLTGNLEFPLCTKDKQRVFMLLTCTTRHDGSDDIIGLMGIGQNIKKPKTDDEKLWRITGGDEDMEQEDLEQGQHELRLFIDTTNAPIFGIDTVPTHHLPP